ncbi:MAG: hypothetical protein P9L92_12405 [Candidatus Electryonea clarkiae]|nr:hypothetical protein [Candidatus Electryonea clarkiae]MDP8287556.1 hypothetical protein [Candidatus Electryonea clarkiae]
MKLNFLDSRLRGNDISIERNWCTITVSMIFGFVLAISNVSAQPLDANHPELLWNTFETDHFVVHYHDGAERTANVIAKIAEEIHPKITGLYGYEPDTKFHFIVKDTDDYANGAAYYYNNKMLIWCTALDYDLRGTTNWLRNVITHEYTHIIQLGAARKAPRPMPAFYFQWIDYEFEKRPDVLYGYPNILASYPIAMTTIPMWFAEGTAQANVPELEYDYWDSHRDMQLRMRALNDSLLPLNDMEVFGKTSLGNEGVYNHGFSLVLYITQKYGADALSDMTQEMKKLHRVDFNKAIEAAIGIDGWQLHEEWASYLKDNYLQKSEIISANEVTGRDFESEGYANLYPKWSSDNEYIYYSSNRGKDYLTSRSIWRKSLETGKAEKIAPEVNSPFDITADGKWMVYSQIVRQKNESYYADIYLRDLEKEKQIRLTRSARAMEPSFSPDEKSLVFVLNKDGTKNIAALELPDREEWRKIKPVTSDSITHITDYRDGTQCWRPRFSPNGEQIVYSMGRDIGREIVLINPDGKNRQIIIDGPGDQRDPAWSSDGNEIYYVSDETGIYNLYKYSLNDESTIALSNVVGSAFMPNVREDGDIVYTEFTGRGFELRILDPTGPVDRFKMIYDQDFIENIPEITFDDTDIDTAETVGYENPFENIFVVPRLAMDYNTFKPGVYLFSSDVLERLFMLAGFSINQKTEFDAFALFDFKALRPTIFLEGYYIKRTDDARFEDPYVIVDEKPGPEPVFDTYGVDYSFHLIEVDGGARWRLFTPVSLEARGVWSRYQAYLNFEDLSSIHYTYFIGRYLQARLDADLTVPMVKGNVHPRKGWAGQLTAAYENNKFFDGFEVNLDKFTLQEKYIPYKYWRLETDVTGWWNPVGKLVFQPRFRGGYLDKQVDPFMHLYSGGLHGMRGYSYYSLGGTRKIIGSLALRHPIYTPKRPRFGWVHFDGLYLGIFGDAGDTWRERDFDFDNVISDAGVELRAKLFSWYGFPTAVTFSAAKGFDQLTVTENNNTTVYDPDWRYYFTLLFDFETIFPSNDQKGRMTNGFGR